MSRQIWRGCLLGAVALGMLATTAAAGDSGDKVALLQSQLDAQQSQIAALEQQLASSSARNQDAARVEVMKQQIREVLSEQEFRESLMPSVMQAGYDKGFYIKSTDDKFKLKINGFMQFRWTHYDTRSRNRYLMPRFERDDRTGFDLQRARLIFSGHAWTPDFTYYVEFNNDSPRGYDTSIHWAYVNYRFCDCFQVQAGVFRPASTRSRQIAEWGFQFVDRPMTDAVFGFDDSLGVRIWGHVLDNKVTYMLDILNSAGAAGNRTITNDPAELDGNPAIMFRAVWHAMGDDLDEWLFEGDVNKLQSPALDIGFSYVFNDDQYDNQTTIMPFPIPRRSYGQGAFGLVNSNGTQINQFSFDAAFKYMGFSAMGEYYVRVVDPRRAGRRPFAPWWLVTRQGDTTAQHGAYAQFGYFLPFPGLEDKLEAVVRAGGISALANGRDGTWEYAAGLNYYLYGAEAGHMAKLQFDVTKVKEVPISNQYSSLANVNDDALVFRVQLQMGF